MFLNLISKSDFTVIQSNMYHHMFICREWAMVKPVENGHSKIDKIKILMTNDSFMKVESIAECSPVSILQYF